ncbi:GNAT family acetyltransferase [Paenibacillus yonginensis]|uniref:GNAT family acetyltransferase n=1 Tax=Paenibacillus yonginensis TaxID=1462996 RepID=A0A1B1MYU6_9BACL|nr:acetyltransferase [Paenibacillus yonginensis]ANS74327.1 GNAT family acetyltransferase [Paenibacillus yonginensis]
MLKVIVPYQAHYHDKLVGIWHRAVVQTHTFLTEQDIEFYHQMVRSGALGQVEIWIEIEEDQEPVGFIGLDGSKIEMLFVDPKYHGRGTGRRLIEHTKALKGDNLQVDVNEQNTGAYVFYERLGFIWTGRSELDASGRPFPLLHLEFKGSGIEAP